VTSRGGTATPQQRRLSAGLAMAMAGAVAFSGKAIIVKLAYAHGVDAVTLLMYRMLFAFPVFAALAWWAGRGQPPLTGRDWAGVLGLGFCGYYLSSYLDFAGLAYITASLERLILYLSPTLVLLLERLLFRKPFKPVQLAGMAISYAGLLLVFLHEANLDSGNTVLGAVLVFCSAASYAVYMVYSGQMVRRLGSLRLVGLATAVACVLCVGQFLLLRPVSAATDVAPQVIWLSVLNATACTALPVLLVMMAIERIGAPLTAQTGMIGPLATIAMGIWLLGEPFTAWVAAGTVLVMAGIYVFTRARA
jgi:drug/metabolite transporter (DMT)-like permease